MSEPILIDSEALSIQVRGEVVASNVDAFREMVRKAISSLNLSPETDEEFGDAELNVKALKATEENVADAKTKALQDAEQLHQLFEVLDETSAEIRDARLKLERQIKAKKEEVREGLVSDAIDKIVLEVPAMRRAAIYRGELQLALKGKRTIESMRKALDVTVKAINGSVGRCRAILDQFESEHGRDLIMDRLELEARTPDQVESELRRRLDLKKAEDERKKAQEEAAKAKAEAAAAKAEAAEQAKPPLPAPRKIDSIPVGARSPSAEWEEFTLSVLTAFKALRAAKDALRHPENVERAARFAQGVNAAWNATKEEVVS